MSAVGAQEPARQVAILVEFARAAMSVESGATEPPAAGAVCATRSGVDCEAFTAIVRAHRVAPLVATHGSDLGLPSEVVDQAQEIAVAGSASAIALAESTVAALGWLAEVGIPALAFKGVALSMLTTGTMGARGEGDIDLLVEPSQVLSAIDVLLEHGWHLDQLTREQARNWWPWIRWSMRAIALNSSQGQVDLHWQAAKERKLLPPASVLIQRGHHILLAGQQVLTVSDDDALLLACYHLHHDHYRSLRQVIDVIRLLRNPKLAGSTWSARELEIITESTNFAVALLGGVSRHRLSALGIDIAPARRAASQWQHHCLDPMSTEISSPMQLLASTRENYRYGNVPVEFARLAVSSTLAYPGRLHEQYGPLTARQLGGAIIGNTVRRVLR